MHTLWWLLIRCRRLKIGLVNIVDLLLEMWRLLIWCFMIHLLDLGWSLILMELQLLWTIILHWWLVLYHAAVIVARVLLTQPTRIFQP